MALTKRSENDIVYLEVKHYCLWRALKTKTNGCEVLEVPNPTTGAMVTKYGYRYDTVSGQAMKLIKYDTERKYSKRYFGFKLHLVDGAETYVLDMPYQSQILKRFLRLARNVDWNFPLSITAFKGKKGKGEMEETGIWFRQRGETVKPYYTKENPHGMPEAIFYSAEQQWDFRAQHNWLVERLKTETTADIEAAAARVAPPIEHAESDAQEPLPDEPEATEIPPHYMATDEDCPF